MEVNNPTISDEAALRMGADLCERYAKRLHTDYLTRKQYQKAAQILRKRAKRLERVGDYNGTK